MTNKRAWLAWVERGMSRRFLIIINLLLVYVSWGSVYIGFKFTLEVLGPFFACGARMSLGGGLLCLALMFFGIWRKPSPKELWRIAILSIFMVFLTSGFLSKGQEYISSGMAAVVSGSTPISMLVGVWLFAGEPRPNLVQCLGLAGGFTGIMLLATGHCGGAETSSLPGMAWVLLATFGWVAGTILTKHYPGGAAMPPMQSCALILLLGGLECLLAGWLCGEASMTRWQNLDLRVAIAFAWMVAGGSVIAYSSYFWLLQHVSTPVAVSYEYVVPIIGIFLGWLLGNEEPTPRMFIACALIVSSVFFVVWHKHNR